MAYKYLVIGDLHGSFKPIRDFHLRHNTEKEYNEAEKIIICLGDFCVNYFLDDAAEGQHRDRQTKEKLGKYPFTYFVIRGNHEERPENLAKQDMNRWHFEEFLGGTVLVENDFPYIKYANDVPDFYQIGDYRTMVFPGAYSVDKHYRLMMGYSWFKDELPTEEEMQIGREMVGIFGGCDLVLSHTCPCAWEPTDLFLKGLDQSTVDKTMERYLGEIEFALDYKAWLFGHFHAYRDYPRTDGRRRTMLYSQEVIDLDQYMNNDEVELL